jgi:hypothetical protein
MLASNPSAEPVAEMRGDRIFRSPASSRREKGMASRRESDKRQVEETGFLGLSQILFFTVLS